MKNGWFSVSDGLPEDMIDVQVTFLGYFDNKPYCCEFAYINNGVWYWSHDDEDVRVEITAWKYNCDPYIG